MKFDKIKPEEIEKDDWLLMVDTKGYESVDQVTCVDNSKVWTKGFNDSQELCETYDELNEAYDAIYKITGEK